MEFIERVAHGYLFAKKYIISKGFSKEIDWCEGLDCKKLTEKEFLGEIVWVILSSGMSDRTIRSVFPKIKAAMFDFESSELIFKNKEECFLSVINIFKHKGKIGAIFYIVDYLKEHAFDLVKTKILNEGISFIETFPYMGKATSYHLAKNLGLNFVKPDRHLTRISAALGINNPFELCDIIADRVAEKANLIDLVLWRYATLDKNYLNNISWYINR
jgi:hypothetical protein